MNGELKRQALRNGIVIQEKTEDFCFETIILTTRTYIVPTFSYSHSTYERVVRSGSKKVYNIEVMIDGRVVSERWGTSVIEMNNQYKILKAHCEG